MTSIPSNWPEGVPGLTDLTTILFDLLELLLMLFSMVQRGFLPVLL